MKMFIAVLSDSSDVRDIHVENELWLSAPVTQRTADLIRDAIVDAWLFIKGPALLSISVFDAKGEVISGKRVEIG